MTKEILAKEFEEFKGQLKSYILRITTSIQDTEDIVQDTYIKAQSNIETFRGDSSLKTWVFSIGSNLAKDNLRSKKRWPENVTDICKEKAMKNHQFFQEAMQINQTSPHGKFEIKEHITMCFTCISKSLPLEQHLVILLKEVYQFRIKEIATIVSQTDAMVKYYLSTGRSTMIKVFDKKCSLINKEGVCHQCTELNGIFNPNQSSQEEIVKIKMARDADKKDKEALFGLRMQVVRGIDPFLSDASDLQLHHLEHNRKVMEKYLKNN